MKKRLRTHEEIQDLKQRWLTQPTFDIEDTKGFEPHRLELLLFRMKPENIRHETRFQLGENNSSQPQKSPSYHKHDCDRTDNNSAAFEIDKFQRQRWESDTRYYIAEIIQDLFSTWIVRTSWGGRHSRKGNYRETAMQSYEQGLDALQKIAQRRQKRGYQPV